MNKEQLITLTKILNCVGKTLNIKQDGYSQRVTILDAGFTDGEIFVSIQTQEGTKKEIELSKFIELSEGEINWN